MTGKIDKCIRSKEGTLIVKKIYSLHDERKAAVHKNTERLNILKIVTRQNKQEQISENR